MSRRLTDQPLDNEPILGGEVGLRRAFAAWAGVAVLAAAIMLVRLISDLISLF